MKKKSKKTSSRFPIPHILEYRPIFIQILDNGSVSVIYDHEDQPINNPKDMQIMAIVKEYT